VPAKAVGDQQITESGHRRTDQPLANGEEAVVVR